MSSPLFFFFFNDPATPEIYPLPLHDALPIWTQGSRAWSRWPSPSGARAARRSQRPRRRGLASFQRASVRRPPLPTRSEEHTSELQSQSNLVCRLLLEKKKKQLTSAAQIST